MILDIIFNDLELHSSSVKRERDETIHTNAKLNNDDSLKLQPRGYKRHKGNRVDFGVNDAKPNNDCKL